MNWRLIGLSTANGATNMAIDETLLASVAAGGAPVLRFYQWERPCLSLGYAQKIAVVDTAVCAQNEWEIVRRLTGGRAVLHQDELTYTLCAAETDACMTGGVLASYKRISQGLAAGLQRLGIALEQTPTAARGNQGSVACFDTPSASEIVFRGRKLLGSAQTRRKGIVLQHGSLPLAGDVGEIADGLLVADKAYLQRELRQQATTLTYALGSKPNAAAVAKQIQIGLSETLGITFTPSSLTTAEQNHIQTLRDQKYTQPHWNGRQ